MADSAIASGPSLDIKQRKKPR